MLDGLIICVIGITTVFVTLTILMFLMMGIERIFHSPQVVEKEREISSKCASKTEIVPYRADVEDMAKVAAIATAVAIHRNHRNQELAHYSPSEAVLVNVNGYRAVVKSMDVAPAIGVRSGTEVWQGKNHHGRMWRAAYTPSQGGYWQRLGWVGERDGHTSTFGIHRNLKWK
jgi:sodium pump decarboxylase gamma subunit